MLQVGPGTPQNGAQDTARRQKTLRRSPKSRPEAPQERALFFRPGAKASKKPYLTALFKAGGRRQGAGNSPSQHHPKLPKTTPRPPKTAPRCPRSAQNLPKDAPGAPNLSRKGAEKMIFGFLRRISVFSCFSEAKP